MKFCNRLKGAIRDTLKIFRKKKNRSNVWKNLTFSIFVMQIERGGYRNKAIGVETRKFLSNSSDAYRR